MCQRPRRRHLLSNYLTSSVDGNETRNKWSETVAGEVIFEKHETGRIIL